MRVKDRLIVGIISGVAGGVAASAFNQAGEWLGWFKSDATAKAAAPFIGRRVRKPLGHAVGLANQATQAMAVGAMVTYALSLTGPRAAALKGMAVASMANSIVFGTLAATIGAQSREPRAAAGGLAAGLVMGAVTGCVAARIGDPSLYNGETPVLAPEVGRRSSVGVGER
ncbi:MAG: hypothetical protein ACM3XN_01745 [Chloroflexota bacterium]